MKKLVALAILIVASQSAFSAKKFEAKYKGKNHHLRHWLHLAYEDKVGSEDMVDGVLRGNGGSLFCEGEEYCVLKLSANPTKVENNHSVIRYIMNSVESWGHAKYVDFDSVKGLKIRARGQMNMETGEFEKKVLLIGKRDQDHMVCTDRAIGGSTLSFGNDYQCQVFPKKKKK